MKTSRPKKTSGSFSRSHRRRHAAKAKPTKKRKDESTAEAEQERLRRDVVARGMSRFGFWRSKVPNPGTRINYALDRQILIRIKGIIKRGGLVALTDEPPRAVLQRRIRHSRLTSAQSARLRRLQWTVEHKLRRRANACITKEVRDGKAVHVVYVPNWDHVSWLIKAMAYSAAIPYDMRAAATVNLSETVLEAALRSDLGFIGYLQDRVARQLRMRFRKAGLSAPDFMIVVEGCPEYLVDGVPHSGEPFHLHGVCDLTWNLASLPAGFRKSDPLRNALRAAAGEVKDEEGKGKKNARQLYMEQAYNVPGWVEYLSKRSFVTAEALDNERKKRGIASLPKSESLIGKSRGIERRGKAWYNEARRSRLPLLKVEKMDW